VLRLQCFPTVLRQRVEETLTRHCAVEHTGSVLHVHPRNMHSSLSGSAASLSVFPQDPLARGSANISASASTNGLRMSSESGSGIQTPSPEVKGIIRDLLSGRLDQAAISFQSVYRGPNAMTTPRGGSSPLPLIKPQEATPAEMVLSSALQHATQLLASKDRRMWETEFASAGIPPKVSRVLGLMVPGGNPSNLKDTLGC
jgi:hypothetical protein